MNHNFDNDLTYMFSSYAKLYKIQAYQRIQENCFLKCKLTNKDYEDILKQTSESRIKQSNSMHDSFLNQSQNKSVFTADDINCFSKCISKFSQGFIISKEAFRNHEIELLQYQIPI